MKFFFKKLLGSLGLMAFGLLLGLVMLEIGLRLIPLETTNLWISRHPTRYQLYQADPKVGWRLRPNATAHYTSTGEFDVQVQINSQGLNDFEHAYQKPPDTFRILLLGDSFSEGINVSIAAGFPHLLESCLNTHYQRPIEVINGGTAYYSSAEELFFLQHEGRRYEPDLVLTAFYVGNDIDAYDSRKSEDGWLDSLGGYLIELDQSGQLSQTWVDWQHPSPYDYISTFEIGLRRSSRLYYIFSHSDSKLADWLDDRKDDFEHTQIGRWLADPQPAPAVDAFSRNLELMKYAPDFPSGPNTPPAYVEAWAILNQVFDQLRQTTNSMQVPLAAIIIPERSQAHERYYQESRRDYADRYGQAIAGIAWSYAAPDEALLKLFAEKNMPSLDLLPIYRAYDATHQDSLYFERDGHLNPTGHELTAEATCDWLIGQNFIGPEPQLSQP